MLVSVEIGVPSLESALTIRPVSLGSSTAEPLTGLRQKPTPTPAARMAWPSGVLI